MSDELKKLMGDIKEQEALDLARALLEEGTDPLSILEQGRKAVEVVGSRFEEGTYFLPELMMAGDMMKNLAALAEPYLKSRAGAEKTLGRVVIGSVAGDIHDIGKDMVTFMLEINRFEVLDLGVDVPVARFVSAVEEFKPQVVGMSALLTTVIEAIKSTVEAVKGCPQGEGVKIMIGGCAVSEHVRQYTGADAFGADAVAAVNLARGWC